MVSDLLPCPFCGGEAGIDRPGTMRASMKISCSNCGATVESGDVLGLTSPEAFAWNRRAEALSRTGAVKVKALEWEERKTRLGTVWWSAPNPLGGLSIEAASENDKIAAQADYEHRVISALEPATPEGRQDNEPRAYIVHAPEDDYYGTGPDRLQFHPLAQHDLDNGYRQTPLYERPAEQAVTDEMVDAACEAFGLHERKHGLDHRQAGMRAALKAAMEEGR